MLSDMAELNFINLNLKKVIGQQTRLVRSSINSVHEEKFI